MKSSKHQPKRSIDGVLFLDKPSGLTSNQAVQSVKRLFQAEKAGHTGTLDPLASGLLPICLGEATKFSQYLLNADKSYLVKAKFGICTTTGDSEGEIISETKIPLLSSNLLTQSLSAFLGAIDQIPPMYSALKQQGKPLYQLARQGIVVDRPSRRVTISELNLLGWTQDTAELLVRCSKGTYIRTLIEDWGKALGFGAHVIALRRTSVGDYAETIMISLEQLQREKDPNNVYVLDHHLSPPDTLLYEWPIQKVDEKTAADFQCGKIILNSEALAPGLIRINNHQDQFIGLGEVTQDGKIMAKRLMSVTPRSN
jgi:tRNA pseudouridine55 synthase